MYTEADRYAAWLILQMAEQGRFEEITAQMIASLLSVMGGDPFGEYAEMLSKISKRVGELLDDDGVDIWQHLLPGGHQGDELPWVVIDPRNESIARAQVQILVVHDKGWIVIDGDGGLWGFEESSYTNVSSPIAGESKAGDIIEVVKQDLFKVDFDQIHQLLN